MPDARDPTPFDQFWSRYPRKVGKLDAMKAWRQVQPPIDEVLAALDWQVKVWDDPQFIPHPATWLRAGRWMDEPDGAYKPVFKSGADFENWRRKKLGYGS